MLASKYWYTPASCKLQFSSNTSEFPLFLLKSVHKGEIFLHANKGRQVCTLLYGKIYKVVVNMN